MIRYCLFFLLLLATACSQFSSPTASAPAQKRPDQLTFPQLEFTFPKVDMSRLSNGMRLYLMADHELPLVEMTLMVEGGSIYDPLNKTGLSALFAATLETGGAGELSAAELENELEAMAAELTVSSSSYDYSIDLSLHQQDLSRGIEILADLLRRPRFETDRLELARKQLLELIRRKNDDPGEVSSRLLAEAVYPGHPFGSTPVAEEVEKLTRDDLIRLQQESLQPQKIWIAVSGDFEKDKLVELLEKSLGDWQPVVSATKPIPALPPQPDGKIWLADKDVPQTSIKLGHSGLSKDNPDFFAVRVANFILGGGGFNSRMMREIRSNRGLAYSVYSYFELGRRLPELFVAGAETKCASTFEVVSLMRQLMQEMREKPVSAAELELAKKSLINSFVFAFSDTHSIVSRRMRLDYFDYPPNYLETYREKIAAVTIADVERVAKKYLRPDQLQIVLVGDTDLFADAFEGFGLPMEKVNL